MFVIIDEYSFIDSDMLFRLDLRLKELTQKQNTDFGGVAVLFFGDIYHKHCEQARMQVRSKTLNYRFLLVI